MGVGRALLWLIWPAGEASPWTVTPSTRPPTETAPTLESETETARVPTGAVGRPGGADGKPVPLEEPAADGLRGAPLLPGALELPVAATPLGLRVRTETLESPPSPFAPGWFRTESLETPSIPDTPLAESGRT